MSTTNHKSRKRGYDVNKLNVQQQTFVKALLADPGMNQTNAAKEAGYTDPSKAAYRLMNNKRVKAIIDKEITQRHEKLDLKGERVLEELQDIAFRDVADLTNDEGQIELSNIRNLPLRVRRSIDGIKIKTTKNKFGEDVTTYEIKLCPKLQAIDMLMKHLGYYEKDNSQKETKVLNFDDLLRIENKEQQVIDVDYEIKK
jgi:phage terminase small subunit